MLTTIASGVIAVWLIGCAAAIPALVIFAAAEEAWEAWKRAKRSRLRQ